MAEFGGDWWWSSVEFGGEARSRRSVEVGGGRIMSAEVGECRRRSVEIGGDRWRSVEVGGGSWWRRSVEVDGHR